MRRAFVLLLLSGCSGGQSPPRPRKAGPALVFDRGTLWVEVARTPGERAQGLMFRESLGPDSGMLFVFDEPGLHPFWMKNTQISLSIAFLDEDMRVIDTASLEPLSEKLYRPKGPALYAVEAPRGWFERHGVGPGARARLAYPEPTRTPPGE